MPLFTDPSSGSLRTLAGIFAGRPGRDRSSATDATVKHGLLLRWLILWGVVLLLLFVAWHQGALAELFLRDRSHISWLIALLFLVTCVHCAWFTAQSSALMNRTRHLHDLLRRHGAETLRLDGEGVRIGDEALLPPCPLAIYLRDLRRVTLNPGGEDVPPPAGLLELFGSHVRNRQEAGWFVAELLIKLGLLGTIVGFILMLSSVSSVTDLDVGTVQKILRKMSSGMATALYTTLAGLAGYMILAVQYQMLDWHADEITDSVSRLTEVYLVPASKGWRT